MATISFVYWNNRQHSSSTPPINFKSPFTQCLYYSVSQTPKQMYMFLLQCFYSSFSVTERVCVSFRVCLSLTPYDLWRVTVHPELQPTCLPWHPVKLEVLITEVITYVLWVVNETLWYSMRAATPGQCQWHYAHHVRLLLLLLIYKCFPVWGHSHVLFLILHI